MLKREGRLRDVEALLKRADGTQYWALVSFEPANLEDERGAYFVWAYDITVSKLAEQGLRESEQRLTSILEASPVGVSIIDDNGVRIWANSRLAEMQGQSVEAMIGGNTDRVIVDSTVRERLLDVFAREGRVRDMEVEERCADGTTYWALLSVESIQYEGKIARINWTYDITDRKEAERELAEKEALLSTALTSMSDGIYVLDSDMRYVMFNQRFMDLIEVAKDKIRIGESVRPVIREMADRGFYGPGDPEQQTENRYAFMANNETAVLEVTTPAGITVHVRQAPLSGGGAVITLTDITESKLAALQLEAARDDAETALAELKAAQNSLIQAEKLASLGQLTAGIAHEVRNPLNFVNNFANLSGGLLAELKQIIESPKSGSGRDDRQELDEILDTLTSNFEQITEHGSRADRIVNSMLMHSRESRETQEVDCNQLVGEVLNLAFHSERAVNPDFDVTLEQDLDPATGTAGNGSVGPVWGGGF